MAEEGGQYLDCCQDTGEREGMPGTAPGQRN